MSLPSDIEREVIYNNTFERIIGLVGQEDDWIAIMATTACELHQAFIYFHWTGFYRLKTPDLLVIGPYQGGHACLRIPRGRGVCGTVVDTGATMLVDDVCNVKNYIACESATQSEIVVPIFNRNRELIAVLDIDSHNRGAFHAVDQRYLESICEYLGQLAR